MCSLYHYTTQTIEHTRFDMFVLKLYESDAAHTNKTRLDEQTDNKRKMTHKHSIRSR